MIPTTNLLRQTPHHINILAANDYTEDHLYEVYDEALAQTKCVMGVVNQCAYYAILEALDRIKQTPLYRQQIKKLLNDALNTYSTIEKRLQHGNCQGNHFFQAEKANPDTPDDHRIPTNQELFDWWLDIGGCAYKRYINEQEMLRLQMLQILTYKQSCKYKAEASYVWLAASMLQYAYQVFNILMRDLAEHHHVSFKKTFRDFSLEPVYHIWLRAANLICPSPDDMSLPKNLTDNLENAFKSFERAIMRDFNTMDSADEAITQNSDLLDPETYAEYRRNYDEAKAEYQAQHS